jgi:hypothetical protein
MLCCVKHSERILTVGQWTGKDSVPNIVRREGTQRVAELGVIVGVRYLYNDNIQGWSSHVSLSLSLAMSVPARTGQDERLGVGLRIKGFGCHSDSDLGFIKRTWSVLVHPLLSATTTATTRTVTAPATTSSVTPTYRMEAPATSLTPDTNEPLPHSLRNERPSSGKPRAPRRHRNNPGRSGDDPQPSDAPKSGTVGGRATPSSHRSTSPEKGNDSSNPQPYHKRKPKPKSSSTLGIKDSGHKPADAKPPTNDSDSSKRRNQGKFKGGTNDASDSKPPRRGNKPAPDHQESSPVPEPTHNSADANPSSLKQGHHRQRRQGKFDGKLTTGDTELRQEGRHANPNRGKHRVDHTADDLTSKLIHDLRTPPYLDCAICFNSIRPHEPTWSCSPSTPVMPTEGSQQTQCCWATFHLKCVRSWASKSVADVRQAHITRGEDKPGQWLCPACRAKRTAEPSSYK